MNDLTEYKFNAADVRTVIINNEPWFVASNVYKILGLTNSREHLKKLNDTEKGVSVIDTLGGAQKVRIINESGLYGLTFMSKKPAAQKFRFWITSEVIPSIRKHNGYLRGQATADQVDALVHAHSRERHALIETIREQAFAIDIMKPSGSFGETSQCNKKPRIKLIPSYFRSPPGVNTDSLSEVIQLYLPLFNVIENSKNKQKQAGEK